MIEVEIRIPQFPVIYRYVSLTPVHLFRLGGEFHLGEEPQPWFINWGGTPVRMNKRCFLMFMTIGVLLLKIVINIRSHKRNPEFSTWCMLSMPHGEVVSHQQQAHWINQCLASAQNRAESWQYSEKNLNNKKNLTNHVPVPSTRLSWTYLRGTWFL